MIVLQGVSEFLAALAEKNAQMSAAARSGVAKAAHMIEAAAKKTLTTSSHAAGTPTPSMPGDPPSLVTGNLRRSITVTGPTSDGPGRWKAEIGPTAIYGRIQELGGETRGRQLPARPYMMPAFTKTLPQIRTMFAEVYTAAILK